LELCQHALANHLLLPRQTKNKKQRLSALSTFLFTWKFGIQRDLEATQNQQSQLSRAAWIFKCQCWTEQSWWQQCLSCWTLTRTGSCIKDDTWHRCTIYWMRWMLTNTPGVSLIDCLSMTGILG
jgi:hypothetical protein